MSGVQLFWLAPLLPLAAFVLLAVGLARYGRLAARLAVAAMAGSTLFSVAGLVASAQGRHALVSLLWLTVGGRQLLLGLELNALNALVATLVSMVGLIVFLYAVGYMAKDAYKGRFFAQLSLFIGSMLALVFAADLMTLFIAWELVGLCSYLLIGFWFERPGVPAAASKAFFLTRLADLALLAGILLLIGATGSGRIDAVLAAATQGKIAPGLLLAIALLAFAGAAGKSAQVPFQGWLPDAMLGPTPVSALLHSATMVAAGVFLLAKLYPLFLAAGPSLQVVAWIGALTSLLGGAAALVESDLKRTLAYSTMSQVGLMFVGLGSGSLLAGVLLLLAHGLYKATLLLASGAVDHAVGGTAFARMGGLAKRMPLTAVAFALSAAALAGLPVTLALPAKDPVLAAAWQANTALFVAALLANWLTALYSARAFGLVFLGTPSGPTQEVREAQPGLLVPLLAMAALIPLGLLAGATLLGSPLSRLLGERIPGVPLVTALALALAVAGVAAGVWAQQIWPALEPVAKLFTGELGFKTLYRVFTHLGFWLIGWSGTIDRAVFDPLTRSLARGTLLVVQACAAIDRRALDAALGDLSEGILAFSQRARALQTGRIENYLLAALVWGLGVIAIAVLAAVVR